MPLIASVILELEARKRATDDCEADAEERFKRDPLYRTITGAITVDDRAVWIPESHAM